MATVPRITFDKWPWHHWLAICPDAIALYQQQTPITWRQLCDDVAVRQNQLPAINCGYIAINSSNQYHTVVTMLAAWQQGLTTLLINDGFSPQDQQQILQHAGIENLPEPLPSVEDNPHRAFARFDENAELTLTLTSGSTGLPKVVIHCAKNHLASASGLFAVMPFEKSGCWLLSLPLFHVSGLAIIWRWLAKGARLKIANTQGDGLALALDGVTHASLVPTQLQRLLQSPQPHHLQSVLLGGASIPQALVDEAERQGVQCWCGYGMTEMASTITVKRADGHCSVGRVLPFRQLSLLPSGEVLVRGETLALGYLVAGKRVSLDFVNEQTATDNGDAVADNRNRANWFATKDVANWQAKSGELQLQGRLDNMFICGGEKVQPETVEQQLSGYQGISQLIILPVRDKIWGQVPVAVVEGDVDLTVFLSWAKSQLPSYQCPKWAITLPNSVDSGGIKLSRAKLAAWLNTQDIP